MGQRSVLFYPGWRRNIEKKTSTPANGLIWFGAAVSIAEILTGALIAPLGFARGLAAIVIGHVIGCALLFLAGLIGGQTQKSAMETVKLSFGVQGARLFAALNVLQLVGWTAVMIVNGAAAAATVLPFGSARLWCVVIGALIVLWVLIGVRNLGRLNIVAVGALFVLTVWLSTLIFRAPQALPVGAGLRFGAAVELSVAMPLSWLPLISDYTRTARKPLPATGVSAAVYFVVSCWMYVIGLGAALFTGESDIAVIMLRAGLGVAAAVIIIFSTVTTTFLDAYSAGVSTVSLIGRVREKPAAIAVCLAGIILALFVPVTRFEDFLYLIGSVFAPMIAILIADFFVLKKDASPQKIDLGNLLIWAAGFVLYRLVMTLTTPVGNTLPVMAATFGLCLLLAAVKKKLPRRSENTPPH